MKNKLVSLPDELAKELEAFPNQNEIIRESLRLYIQHIDSNKLQGLQAAYKIIKLKLDEMDSKLDYLAKKIDS